MPFGGVGLCCCCCFCVILQNIYYSHKLPKHYLCNKFVIQIVFRKFLTMILFGLLITTEIQYDKSLENIRCFCFPLQKDSKVAWQNKVYSEKIRRLCYKHLHVSYTLPKALRQTWLQNHGSCWHKYGTIVPLCNTKLLRCLPYSKLAAYASAREIFLKISTYILPYVITTKLIYI